jgi:hypothetical protein
MYLVPSLIRDPSEALGIWMPSPIKLRNDSAKMASGMVKITEIIMGPRELVMRCFHTSLNLSAPREREARAYSWSFSCSILPRTILAM